MSLELEMAKISRQSPVNKHYKTREITMMEPNWLQCLLQTHFFFLSLSISKWYLGIRLYKEKVPICGQL